MNKPLISIVVCCYNRRHLLEQTMESIFVQDYKPVEIIVVDDGSTDNTHELIKSYGDKVRYYQQENKGIAVTRTIACQLAKGDYIAFQDDDDLMPPNRITSLYEALSQYPTAVLVLGDFAFMDEDGSLTGGKSHYKICDEIKDPIDKPLLIEDGYNAIMWPKVSPLPHTTLFRKADAEKIGGFDPRFYACSDTDFFGRLGRLGPVVYVPEVVSYYRRGHSSIWKKVFLAEYSRFLLFEKHLRSLENERKDLRRQLRRRMLAPLKGIAYYQSQGRELCSIPEDYLSRGLSLLGLKETIKYKWYTLIRLPIRKLIKGFS